MKLLWLAIFFTVSTSLLGQIEVKPLAKNSSSVLKNARSSAFTTLPFWDDFSTSDRLPGDQWELSESVEISTGLSVNAPTYKAATLDGIDSTGAFYSDTEKFAGRTDQLISKAIDLSTLAGDESIYLSFFWEAGGNGEHPEDASDSLRLQLLNQDSVWVTAWKMAAPEILDFGNFTQEIVQITSNYRHEYFRFKFETYGSQQGRFDTWHIDYVYMNNERTASDLTYLDRAFSGQLQSIVFPYHEMPAHHFFRNPSSFLSPQSFTASNLTSSQHTLQLDYELKVENTGETYVFQDATNTFASREIKTATLVTTPNVPSVMPPPDSIVFSNMITSDFMDDQLPVDYQVNDMLSDTLLFHDYYAYDDGEAEFVAGVSENGSVGIEYVIGEQDTLTHIDIFFPKSHETAIGKTLQMSVWIYLDSGTVTTKSYTVKEADLDRFVRISLVDPIVVEDTVYVGYKQDTNTFFPVGLDRNNQAAKEKMYYLSGNQWLQNQQANGIMMIRPVFKPLGDLVLSSTPLRQFNIYPNPSSGLVKIEGEYNHLKVFSVSGELLIKQNRAETHDLSHLKSGIYILHISKQNGLTESIRFIKE